MGVPSRGRDYCVEHLSRFHPHPVPLFANIGGFSADEIATSFAAVELHVDGVEISLMCPNLKPGEAFDEIALLRDVLARIEGRRKPAIVRVPNDTVRSSDRLAELVERCVEAGVEGLKVAGGRTVMERARHRTEAPCTDARRSRLRSPMWKTPRVWPAVTIAIKGN